MSKQQTSQETDNLKNIQLKITSKSYDALNHFADEKGVPMATVIRDAIAVYALLGHYVEKGNKLYLEDPETKEKAQLLITGLS